MEHKAFQNVKNWIKFLKKWNIKHFKMWKIESQTPTYETCLKAEEIISNVEHKWTCSKFLQDSAGKKLNHDSMITFFAANTIEAKCIICDVGWGGESFRGRKTAFLQLVHSSRAYCKVANTLPDSKNLTLFYGLAT